MAVVWIDIRRIRTQHGWSQQTLANLLGVSQSAVANWEYRGNQPNARTIYKIARLLDCPIDDLYTEEPPA